MNVLSGILFFDLSYILFTLLLYALSYRLPKLTFYARFLAAVGSLVVCACYGVVASIVLRLGGFGGLSQWTTARSFKWVMWWTTGVWFGIVEGAEYLEARPAVFVGNHQSELDVLMLGAVFPKYCSVTAKKSLRLIPFLGWFMALSKSVFIDRANSKTARAAFDGAARHMRDERQSVFIFPEGTRSYFRKPDMLPFKKGAFHLAVQAQVPIVPCVVENYNRVLDIKGRRFNSGNIRVKVLKPISTSSLTAEDVNDLVNRTRDQMLEALLELSDNSNGHASTRVEVPNGVKKDL